MLWLVDPLVGELVRQARADAGLSRRSLAARAGVPTSTVSRVEDGLSDPTVSMLDRLLTAAGRRLVLEDRPRTDEPTIAALATAATTTAGGRLKIDWTRLRGFADWASRHPDELAAALALPPARTGTPLDAILAAFAEELADNHHLERPRWTRSVGPLAQPWTTPGTPRMHAAATAATPEPFRRRNLVLQRAALFRDAT
jgi:transcriptional regulator with XRE-family HTH domain